MPMFPKSRNSVDCAALTLTFRSWLLASAMRIASLSERWMPSLWGAGIVASPRGPGFAFTTEPTGPLSGAGGFLSAGAGVSGDGVGAGVCAATICAAAKRMPAAAARVPRTQNEIFISTTPLSPPNYAWGSRMFRAKRLISRHFAGKEASRESSVGGLGERRPLLRAARARDRAAGPVGAAGRLVRRARAGRRDILRPGPRPRRGGHERGRVRMQRTSEDVGGRSPLD